MISKFIVGKWYKGFRLHHEITAKFKEIGGDTEKNDRYFRFSEYIRTDNNDIITHEVFNGSWYNEPQLFECPLSEIFDYLPEGHPDKVTNVIFENEDISYLIPILEKHNIK